MRALIITKQILVKLVVKCKFNENNIIINWYSTLFMNSLFFFLRNCFITYSHISILFDFINFSEKKNFYTKLIRDPTWNVLIKSTPRVKLLLSIVLLGFLSKSKSSFSLYQLKSYEFFAKTAFYKYNMSVHTHTYRSA